MGRQTMGEKNSAPGNRNVNVHIDHRALETSIETAIENAMRSVERLERLQIQIEPMEIKLGGPEFRCRTR